MNGISGSESILAGLKLQQAEAKSNRTSLGQEEFLALMITQLKNQDPMKPLENGEFIGQMAQFSTVAGIGEMTKSMASLSDTFRAGQGPAGRGHRRPYRAVGRRQRRTGCRRTTVGRGRRSVWSIGGLGPHLRPGRHARPPARTWARRAQVSRISAGTARSPTATPHVPARTPSAPRRHGRRRDLGCHLRQLPRAEHHSRRQRQQCAADHRRGSTIRLSDVRAIR